MQALRLQAARVIKALPQACELAEHQLLLDDPFTELPVHQGVIAVPQTPGCGVGYATAFMPAAGAPRP